VLDPVPQGILNRDGIVLTPRMLGIDVSAQIHGVVKDSADYQHVAVRRQIRKCRGRRTLPPGE